MKLAHLIPLFALAIVAAPSGAQMTNLSPVDFVPASDAAGWSSNSTWNSANGRYTLFTSQASNLVAGQQDSGTDDLFVHDRLSGSIQMVSHRHGAPASACGSSFSYATGRAISADGRWISYYSQCPNLVAGLKPDSTDNVYLYDRQTGQNRLVSAVPGSGLPAGNSQLVDMSADGRWLLFASHSTTLVGGSGGTSLFLADREDPTGNLRRIVDRAVAGPAYFDRPMSADAGVMVVRSTLQGLDPEVPDTGTSADLFVFNAKTGSFRMVNRIQGQNLPSDGTLLSPGYLLSEDGRVLVYHSRATNIAGSGAGIFAYDISTDQNQLLVPGSANVVDRLIDSSIDGEWLLYSPGTSQEVRLVRRSTGVQIAVSRSAVNQQPVGFSTGLALSADGRYALFSSFVDASQLVAGVVDSNQTSDLFIFDRMTEFTRLLTANRNNAQQTAGNTMGQSYLGASLSADGEVAAYASNSGSLAVGVNDANGLADIYLSQITGTPATQLATRATPPRVGLPQGGSKAGPLTPDGRWLTYYRAGWLRLRDSQTGDDQLVCRSHFFSEVPADGFCQAQAISPDGRWVWFRSAARTLVANYSCISFCSELTSFLYDRNTRSVILLAHRPGETNIPLIWYSYLRGVSSDGRWSLLEADPEHLTGPTSTKLQVFLYDRTTRSPQLLTHAAGAPGTPANGDSAALAMSPDGRWILFTSLATNLVAGVIDANQANDVFLYDRETATTRLVSHAAGVALQTANGASDNAALSADGSVVILQSAASNLVGGVTDSNGVMDVFRYVVADSSASLMSQSAATPNHTANGASQLPPSPFLSDDIWSLRNVSHDGQQVLIRTEATNLGVGVSDQNAAADLYLVDLATSSMRLVTHSPGTPLQAAPANTYRAMLSANGQRVLFEANGSGLAAGAAPSSFRQVYLHIVERELGNILVSAPVTAGVGSNGAAFLGDMDAEGTLVSFSSQANNLLPEFVDQNNTVDGFLFRNVIPLFANGFED